MKFVSRSIARILASGQPPGCFSVDESQVQPEDVANDKKHSYIVTVIKYKSICHEVAWTSGTTTKFWTLRQLPEWAWQYCQQY